MNDQGLGMPNSSGDFLVMPALWATQAVVDCHFFRKASASLPEMFIET